MTASTRHVLKAAGTFGSFDLALKAPPGPERDCLPPILFWPEPLRAGQEADRFVAAVAAGLTQAGFNVVLPSTPSLIRVEQEALVLRAAAAALREHAAVDAERIALIGYSLGGLLVADRAADCQPLHRVALLAPTALETVTMIAASEHKKGGAKTSNGARSAKDVDTAETRSASNADASSEAADPSARHPVDGEAAVDLAARWKTREAQAAVKKMRPVARLEALDCPVLIMHGAADAQAPARIGGRWAWSASQERDRPIESMLIARGDHTFSNSDVRGTCLSELLRFFAPMLGQSPPGSAKPRTDSAA